MRVLAVIKPFQFLNKGLAKITNMSRRAAEAEPTQPEKSFEDGEHVEPVYLKSIVANLSDALK
ncbi:hypothetical protein D030_3013 [Vibrio parahaemolyticus AQ3810]|nr:hypothetical protein D030_3013 [Vibrio parahaemolyticus AQ3810]